MRVPMIWIAPPWGSELPEPYAKVFVSLPFTAGLAIVFRYAAGLFLAATLVMALARRPSVLEQPELASPPVSPIVNPRFLGLLVVVFFTIIALSVPQQLTALYLQNVQHLSIQQIGTMGTIASIGTAIIMLSLGHLRVSTGMLIGQLLLAGFALLLYNYRPEAVYIASLGALTITVGLNRLLFREKRNAMLPVQT